ncbi:hypothetical protein GVAV_003325 [Gurleya vavrai]
MLDTACAYHYYKYLDHEMMLNNEINHVGTRIIKVSNIKHEQTYINRLNNFIVSLIEIQREPEQIPFFGFYYGLILLASFFKQAITDKNYDVNRNLEVRYCIFDDKKKINYNIHTIIIHLKISILKSDKNFLNLTNNDYFEYLEKDFKKTTETLLKFRLLNSSDSNPILDKELTKMINAVVIALCFDLTKIWLSDGAIVTSTPKQIAYIFLENLRIQSKISGIK